MARRKATTHSRVVEKSVETEDASGYRSVFKHYKKIYPNDYKPPQSIKEALVNAGMDDKGAEEAEEMCVSNAESLRDKGLITDEFSAEDAAAVTLYTFDFGKEEMYDMNPYRLLNKALNTKRMKEKTEEIVKVRMCCTLW